MSVFFNLFVFILHVKFTFCGEILHLNNGKYSLPPSNLPITKVFIRGNPVYLRNMKATLNGNVVDRNDVVSVDNSAKNIFHDTRINDSPKNVIQNDYYQVTKPLMVYNKPHRKITYSGYDFVTEPPKTNNFPLKECYTNNSGFMCCNPQLERVILDAFNKLKLSQGGRWQKCNTQSIANEIQSSAQSKFNKTFETIAGIGDYASKSHFYSNLICKVEQGGRFMLAYATPVQAPVKVTAETEMMPY